MIDNGSPLTTEPNILREMIAPPNLVNKMLSVVTGNSSNMSDTLPGATSSLLPWRTTDPKYGHNEVYVDLVEEIDTIINRDGVMVKCEIYGEVQVNSHFTGVPDLTFSFANPSILDDVRFHPCVRFRPWESQQILSFVPPEANELQNSTFPFVGLGPASLSLLILFLALDLSRNSTESSLSTFPSLSFVASFIARSQALLPSLSSLPSSVLHTSEESGLLLRFFQTEAERGSDCSWLIDRRSKSRLIEDQIRSREIPTVWHSKYQFLAEIWFILGRDIKQRLSDTDSKVQVELIIQVVFERYPVRCFLGCNGIFGMNWNWYFK